MTFATTLKGSEESQLSPQLQEEQSQRQSQSLLLHNDSSNNNNNNTTNHENNNACEDNDDDYDTYDDDLHPIVVGYAFGPKKMSTMGTVMAQASVWQQQQQQQSSSPDEADERTSTTTTTTMQHQQKMVFTVGEETGGLLSHMMARFHSDESVGTCTASHASSCSTTRPSTTRSSASSRLYHPVSFVPVDLTTPSHSAPQQQQYDVILHKLTEDILCWSLLVQQYPTLQDLTQWTTPAALQQALERFHQQQHDDDDDKDCTRRRNQNNNNSSIGPTEQASLLRVHRLCQMDANIVDPPVKVQTLMSRQAIAETLQTCLRDVRTASGWSVACPASRVCPDASRILQDLDNTLRFPVIVKPLIAAGTQASHNMAIVFANSPLQNSNSSTTKQPSPTPQPCLVQEYCNHGAILYKVYVLGSHVSVHPRRSLPDLPRCGGKSLQFDSQKQYPRLSDFECTASEVAVAAQPTNNNSSSSAMPKITDKEVQPVAEALKQAFGVELFGFDIIVSSSSEESDHEDDTNHHPQQEPSHPRIRPPQASQNHPNYKLLVVDVNYFPSYKEVPQFPALLAQYLTLKAVQYRESE